jgi:hypothetical protein
MYGDYDYTDYGVIKKPKAKAAKKPKAKAAKKPKAKVVKKLKATDKQNGKITIKDRIKAGAKVHVGDRGGMYIVFDGKKHRIPCG